MIYKALKRAQKKLIDALSARERIENLADLLLNDLSLHLAKNHPNPFNKFGRKVYSQTDEDGLTFEIIRRLGIEKGSFAEYGVGNGLENNTLAMTALGWDGFWVGGQNLAFVPPGREKEPLLVYLKSWITRENIVPLTQKGLQAISKSNLDLISLDLDGNDIYFVEELLKNGFNPSLFIVEYNAKFPPPIRWSVKYDPELRWDEEDYFGASLSAFYDLFKKYGYFLVCCNSHSGSNAFFVSEKFKQRFPEIPEDISLIYSPQRYYLYYKSGWKSSPKTVASFFKKKSND